MDQHELLLHNQLVFRHRSRQLNHLQIRILTHHRCLHLSRARNHPVAQLVSLLDDPLHNHHLVRRSPRLHTHLDSHQLNQFRTPHRAQVPNRVLDPLLNPVVNPAKHRRANQPHNHPYPHHTPLGFPQRNPVLSQHQNQVLNQRLCHPDIPHLSHRLSLRLNRSFDLQVFLRASLHLFRVPGPVASPRASLLSHQVLAQVLSRLPNLLLSRVRNPQGSLPLFQLPCQQALLVMVFGQGPLLAYRLLLI